MSLSLHLYQLYPFFQSYFLIYIFLSTFRLSLLFHFFLLCLISPLTLFMFLYCFPSFYLIALFFTSHYPLLFNPAFAVFILPYLHLFLSLPLLLSIHVLPILLLTILFLPYVSLDLNTSLPAWTVSFSVLSFPSSYLTPVFPSLTFTLLSLSHLIHFYPHFIPYLHALSFSFFLLVLSFSPPYPFLPVLHFNPLFLPHISPGLSISNYFRLIPFDPTLPFSPDLSFFMLSLFFPPYISPMLSLLYLSNRLIPALLLQSFCLIFNLALSISNYSRLIFLTFYLLPPYPDTSCLTFQPFISASYFISHYTFLTIPTLSLFFSPYHFPTALFLVRPYSCSSRIILVFTDLSLSIH